MAEVHHLRPASRPKPLRLMTDPERLTAAYEAIHRAAAMLRDGDDRASGYRLLARACGVSLASAADRSVAATLFKDLSDELRGPEEPRPAE